MVCRARNRERESVCVCACVRACKYNETFVAVNSSRFATRSRSVDHSKKKMRSDRIIRVLVIVIRRFARG